MRSIIALAATAAATISVSALADTVTLSNGDKITGTIGQVTGAALKFESPALGKIEIDMANVASYTFDSTVKVQPKGAPAVTGKVEGTGTEVKVDNQSYAYGQVKSVNPPKQEWKGVVVANASLSRGNTNKFTGGLEAHGQLRRDDDVLNDRFTLDGAYNYGTSGGGPGGAPSTTDIDNWHALGQYDKFWDEKFYTYGNLKMEHDRIAQIYYRVMPGVGLGYQWIETPKMHFSTEAGISYIRTKYDTGDSDDAIAARLAYHYDNKLSDKVTMFHNVEFLPAFEDPGDYILNADLGIRANLTEDFFAQFKVLWQRDSTPAEGSLKNDLQYVFGIGWEF